MRQFTLVGALLCVIVLGLGAPRAGAEEWPELVPETFAWGDSSESIQCGADLRPVLRPYTCWGEIIRCKTQRFSASWSQATIYTVLRYEGTFKVCYVHSKRIVSVVYRFGDATFVRIPWEWHGNDSGYPYHIRREHNVEFNFRGTAQFCILKVGCGPEKHPWVRITFFDNNTLDKDQGVVG
jgi:hypothetical protein